MALTTATISGKFTLPDGVTPLIVSVTITPTTAGGTLRRTDTGDIFAASYSATGRKSDGLLTITIPQIPQASIAPSDARWQATFTVVNPPWGGPNLPIPSKTFDLTADRTWGSILTDTGVTITSSILAAAEAARDQAAGSATAAAASATAAGSSASGGVVGRVRSTVATNGTDQTTVLQGEIDALSGTAGGTRGGVLLLPQGTILVSSLVLKDRVTLQGVGEEATILKTLSGSTATSLITIPAGPVQQAYLQDLSIYGNGVTGQNGVYLRAVASAGVGGWWYSGMRNVRVRFFDGVPIWLRAGTPGAGTPHQFLTFANVQAYSANTQPALRLSGQAGQIVFDDTCYFGGPAQANVGGMCIDIRREVNDDLTVASDTAPYSVVFDGTTLQNNETGLKVDRSSSVFWRNGHMETISQGVLAQTSAIVTVDGGTMSSVGAFAGAGYLFKVLGSSVIRVNDMVMNTASADKHFIATSGNIIATNCAVTDGSDPLTTTLTKQLNVDTVTVPGQLSLGFNRHAIVNTTTQQITSIVQAGAPGESIFIHALSGPLTFNTGGNIHASGLPMPYTIPKDTIVQLVKMDVGGSPWKFVTTAKVQETSTTAALASATNAINTAGKYVGRMLWNTTTSRPVWATGALTTSTWVFGDGTTAHTPI